MEHQLNIENVLAPGAPYRTWNDFSQVWVAFGGHRRLDGLAVSTPPSMAKSDASLPSSF